MFTSSHQREVDLQRRSYIDHILRSPARLTTLRRFGLVFLRYPGWLGPVPRGSESRHMTVESRFIVPIRVECLQQPPAMARPPGSISAQAAFLPIAGTLRRAAIYIILSPHPNLPFFSPDQSQAAIIDNPSLSTTTLRHSIGSEVVRTSEIRVSTRFTICTIYTATEDVQPKRQ